MEANINMVQPKNHISLALMYDTFGRFLLWPEANVINDSIVDVPIKNDLL